MILAEQIKNEVDRFINAVNPTRKAPPIFRGYIFPYGTGCDELMKFNTEEREQFLNELAGVLRECTLCPTFEKYGNFAYICEEEAFPETVKFFGNFQDRSFVFSIETNCPKWIGILTRTIRENQAGKKYAKAKDEIERAEARERAEKERKRLLASKPSQATGGSFNYAAF